MGQGVGGRVVAYSQLEKIQKQVAFVQGLFAGLFVSLFFFPPIAVHAGHGSSEGDEPWAICMRADLNTAGTAYVRKCVSAERQDGREHGTIEYGTLRKRAEELPHLLILIGYRPPDGNRGGDLLSTLFVRDRKKDMWLLSGKNHFDLSADPPIREVRLFQKNQEFYLRYMRFMNDVGAYEKAKEIPSVTITLR